MGKWAERFKKEAMENSTTSALSVTNSGILPKRNEASVNFTLSALSVPTPCVFPKNNDIFTKKSLYNPNSGLEESIFKS